MGGVFKTKERLRQNGKVNFADELMRVLPADTPQRETLIEKSSQYLELVARTNDSMNLTRLTNPMEAAVKHVFDSVYPWLCFQKAARILDAGTGAGFPGVPLALALPQIRFTLAESVLKKARFVEQAVEAVHLPNVHVAAERAEKVAETFKPDIITARAVAPLHKLLDLFTPAMKQGSELMLFKGPDIEAEMATTRVRHIRIEVVLRYDLPESLGSRTIVRARFQR